MDGTPYYQFYDEKRGIGLDQNGLRVKTPFVSYGNWFKDYFKTGWTTTNSLSLSAKLNRNNSMRLSISDTRSESITPNSPAMRQSIKLNSHNKVNNWLSMNTSITYYRRDCDNLPQMGYGQASVMYSLWCMAPNINMDWARDYWIDPGVQQNANLTGSQEQSLFRGLRMPQYARPRPHLRKHVARPASLQRSRPDAARRYRFFARPPHHAPAQKLLFAALRHVS